MKIVVAIVCVCIVGGSYNNQSKRSLTESTQNEVTVKEETGWSEWFVSSPCSTTCGRGTVFTSRVCLRTELPCTGSNMNYTPCNIKECPNMSASLLDYRDLFINISINANVTLKIDNGTGTEPAHYTFMGGVDPTRAIIVNDFGVGGSHAAFSFLKENKTSEVQFVGKFEDKLISALFGGIETFLMHIVKP